MGLSGTQTTTGINGRPVSIVELRGWLRSIAGGCNGGDPDWHYTLELDLEWLDQIGLNVESLLQPGDSICNEGDSGSEQPEVSARSSARAIFTAPLLHVELDAWPRTDPARGNPPKPVHWTFTNDCNQGAAFWPFDPRNPKPGDPPLAAGQYLRVVGSLVTDEPHMSQDQLATNMVLRLGYVATVSALGAERAAKGQTNAIKWIWSGVRGETDRDNPARWNEVHSPDYFEVLSPKSRNETVRCVAVCAQNGLFSGDVESIAAEIRAPGRPTRWHVLSTRKRVGASTIASTVQIDEVTSLPDRVRIRAQVQGQAGLGAAGKFFAVYRVGWRGIAPALHACVSANGMGMLAAVDADGRTVARPSTAGPPYWPSAWTEVVQGRSAPGGHTSAVSRAPGYFDLFTVGTDRHVYTAAQAGGPWAGWWQIAGLNAPPGAPISGVSRSANKLDVFMADDAGRVMSAAWEPGFAAWHGWWHIQQGMTAPGGTVTSVSRRADFLDIFCVGTDGRSYTAAWTPADGWHGWWSIGVDHFPHGSALTAVARSLDKLDIFATDVQGRVLTAFWRPGLPSWQSWSPVVGGVVTPGARIAVACRRPDFMDIFAVGLDGNVYTAAWEPAGAQWHGWWVVPGMLARPGTPIEAFSPGFDVLVVVTTSSAGHVVCTHWTPATGWAAWAPID